jgi:hypothetical protein
MAQTWTAYFQAVAFGNAKNMAAILNTHATEKLSIYRVGILNTQTAAVTGVLVDLQLRVYQSGSPSLSSPTAITPTPHDSTNTAPASATYGHAGTIAGTAQTLRRIAWSNDEPAVSSATSDEFECLVPWNIIWDAGYGDSNVQPLTLNQNQMVLLFCNTNSTVGTLDTWMEFTKS